MKILKAGLLYFVIVFGTGFVLGIIRTLWLVPRVGTRAAELIEMPLMLIAIILAAKFVINHYDVKPVPMLRLGIGLLAFVLLVATEFTVVLWVRGLSFGDYQAARDPVSGSVYYVMLLVFLFMPLFVPAKSVSVEGHSVPGVESQG